MKYCEHCGQSLQDDAAYCTGCGRAARYYAPNTTQQPERPPVTDTGSIGWGFLGFLFPIVGLVLYLVWKNDRPRNAKRAGVGALVGFILGIISGLLFPFI
ncbi:MAG TPA: zinc ribbon domain-containing protein [Eubacteriales bacterium]|jgi:uncharacterized membrane protein YvbJ|nr:zinc ribbon domain-containing protein [Clostridia bacterium]HRR89930.1 zinc ribbon domain-containing protein [Eubacteriales bacterium]HRU83921.1 zinc ribbon domain-containing protein [Eubacteriales bacterium]